MYVCVDLNISVRFVLRIFTYLFVFTLIYSDLLLLMPHFARFCILF